MWNCCLHLLLVFLSKPLLSFQILANLLDFVSHIFIVGRCGDTFMCDCTYLYIYTVKDKSFQNEGLLKLLVSDRAVCICDGTVGRTKACQRGLYVYVTVLLVGQRHVREGCMYM